MTIPAQFHADDVVIDRLSVKGAVRNTTSLQRALTQADWPTAPGESWVFIREVRVASPRHRLVSQLVSQTRAQMAKAGASGNPDAVRFGSYAELLAWLMTDLATGEAERRWYWKRFAHLFKLPTDRAVAAVMEDQPDHLPTLTAWLSRLGALPSVWNALGRAEAGRLAGALSWRSGFRLPAAPVPVDEREPAIPPVSIPSEIQRRWSDALSPLPPEDARRTLAQILIAREVWPWLLHKAPTRLLNALARGLSGVDSAPLSPPSSTEAPAPAMSTSPPLPLRKSDPAAIGVQPTAPSPDRDDDRTPAPAPRSLDGDGETTAQPESIPTAAPAKRRQSTPEPTALYTAARPHRPKSEVADRAEGIVDNRGVDEDTETASPVDSVERTVPSIEVEARRDDAEVSRAAIEMSRAADGGAEEWPAAPLFGAGDPPVAGAPAATPLSERFMTRQGGLFYLLNFLNRSQVQAVIDAENAWRLLPSGWGWLYRLGQELALDDADPVVRFLAEQMGFDGIDALGRLPALPARESLLSLAQHWYGRGGLWNPALLQLEAVVRYTQSHVDIHAALDSVRLPVRLAGLDINPGWLPWLGRVVTFHYSDSRTMP